MDILLLLNIIKSASFKEFLSTYGATHLMDFGFKGILKLCKNNNNLETQLLNAINDSLENTFSKLYWECDTDLITESFVYELYVSEDVISIDVIKNIIMGVIRKIASINIQCDIYGIWLTDFTYVLLNPKYSKLKDYLMINNHFDEHDKLNEIKNNTDYIANHLRQIRPNNRLRNIYDEMALSIDISLEKLAEEILNV